MENKVQEKQKLNNKEFIMKSKILILLSLLGSLHVASADVSGVGYGDTTQKAKKSALADLAGNIKSEVRSDFEIHDTDNTSRSKSDIKVSSNLPILGADFEPLNHPSDMKMKAMLSSKKVTHLYSKKLQQLNSEILSIQTELKNNSSKLELYEDIYSLLLEYDRYESVAVILGATLPKRPSINKAQVKIEISKINSNLDTLTKAASALAMTFDERGIFVYAPQLKNYTTISQFSSVFTKELKGKLQIGRAHV